ncbi:MULTISPECIES: RNA polymerase sigma-70 factor [Olivibacter]|uniref:RNA polymerase sigma-70 factor n=1 Tax=Olivibacter jilunii TaxID=985016 RepID=A0ABW6B6I4_9SPHI|nr:RNA polymerase sigma-70 factor [Pseudosphingobacterium sp.]
MKARPTDEFSVDRFRKGDESAFDYLFRQLYGPLCTFAEGIVGDEYIAEELAQAAFIKLWKKRSGFASLLKIKAFLYIVIKNDAFNHLKKEKSRLKIEQQLSQKLPFSEQDITDRIIYTEMMLILDRAISDLPERCKKVIELSYHDEKSSKEIAEAMGVSVSTVDNQRARGIQLLKKSLAKVGLLSFLPILLA